MARKQEGPSPSLGMARNRVRLPFPAWPSPLIQSQEMRGEGKHTRRPDTSRVNRIPQSVKLIEMLLSIKIPYTAK